MLIILRRASKKLFKISRRFITNKIKRGSRNINKPKKFSLFRHLTSLQKFGYTTKFLSKTNKSIVKSLSPIHLISSKRIHREADFNFPKDPQIPARTSIEFTLKDHPGALLQVLSVIAYNNINVTRISSRYIQDSATAKFMADVELPRHHHRLNKCIKELETVVRTAEILPPRKVPWFPITLDEIDSCALLVLEGGTDLPSDHPGFNDPEYKKERAYIANEAYKFQLGNRPAKINYSKEQTECWGLIWNTLYPLIQKHACEEYLEVSKTLFKECGYSDKSIPQLADISEFMYNSTGFRLRPTAGLLSSRHFLNGLAFRTFFCTQYLRHMSKPFYTPEPDVVHELIGHAPMFCDPEFAQFSQEIGLASIGATDQQIEELARCYWYSLEFGLCKSKDGSQRKIYGAGVLSSVDEIEHAMSDKPEFRDWNPFIASQEDFPITTLQPTYYVCKNFQTAKDKMQRYAATLDKSFSLRWDDVNERLIVDGNIYRDVRKEDDFGTYGGKGKDDL